MKLHWLIAAVKYWCKAKQDIEHYVHQKRDIDDNGRNKEGRTKGSATNKGMGQELKWKKNDQGTEGYGFGKVK
jgi:hypothetical protein